MVQRLTYRKHIRYNTKGNKQRKVKTPGGRLVFQQLKKKASPPKCGDCGKQFWLHIVTGRSPQPLAAPPRMSTRVSYEDAEKFLRRCRARPERMRVLCSTKASREGGDEMAVDVEVSPGGPVVQVREISMARGWTGCRFSPSALWLALALARRFGGGPRGPPEEGARRQRSLELGCGVALAGLTAHALGFDTTLTDILDGHLESLSSRLRA
ncbi:unnamed protein product [Prorocentrum cordatum]|uniref:60S ribosomal protein L34 n=1 Tax=Prorocentrum cordatum TaxID=2364126 RepID=A0ABN9V436_9DINO|nr:unnamed protein product [Polarella glacialis]